jgi:hypothetical protein
LLIRASTPLSIHAQVDVNKNLNINQPLKYKVNFFEASFKKLTFGIYFPSFFKATPLCIFAYDQKNAPHEFSEPINKRISAHLGKTIKFNWLKILVPN